MTIERRARNYRYLILGIGVIGSVSLAGAFLSGSARPLVGLTVVSVIAVAFFAADGYLLQSWRAELLVPWARRDLDIAALRAAVLAHPLLPRQTTEAMLATLPGVGELAIEQQVSSATREAGRAVTLARYRSHAAVLTLKVGVVALAIGLAVAALLMRRVQPLIGMISLAVVPVLMRWMDRRQRVRLSRELAMWRAQPDFDEGTLQHIVGRLQ